MIKNETQYRVTKNQAAKFAQSLAELDRQPAAAMHPIRRKAHLDSLQSQHDELLQELADYEALKKGQLKSFNLETFDDLPLGLIKARIVLGLSQKDLADLLGLKEQQIQRYEATSYAGASYDRLRSVVRALKLNITETVSMPDSVLNESYFFKNLSGLGFSKEFVLQRLLPQQLATDLREQKKSTANTPNLFRAASIIGEVLGVEPARLMDSQLTTLDLTTVYDTRFKRPVNTSLEKIGPYALYARTLASTLLDACENLKRKEIPGDYNLFRNQVIANYQEISFETVLRYVWDLGIPVLPLDDSKYFHGACWRINGRNVIVLKQKTHSSARWLFDLLHELDHAAQSSDQENFAVIESSDNITGEAARSLEERKANHFAAQVLLNGRAIDLAHRAVNEINGHLPRLKEKVREIAQQEGVNPGHLANYLAYRLTVEQDANWWGAANSLQTVEPNAWQTARQVLFEYTELTDLPDVKKEMLLKALQ